MQLRDNLTLDTKTARICADGSLVAEVRAARVGIQDYLASEMGDSLPQGFTASRVRVYRPESEVFKADSMATFAAAPFTIDHPAEPVTADNWRELGKGEVNGDVVRDGGFVRVPVIVRDASAVEKVRTTHKQLSMGYACTLDWTPGTTADGEAYDAVQRNIRINHIAAVPAARGGPELKISDERAPIIKEKPAMATIIVDGLPVSLADEAAVRAVIEKKDAALVAADKALADANDAHDKALAAKDAEIDGLKAQVIDQAAIDALADAKADIVAKGKALLGDKMPDAKGKSVADLRKAIVVAKLGDAMADKSDAYIEARFDALSDAAPETKVAAITPTKTADGSDEVAAARARWLADKSFAHKAA